MESDQDLIISFEALVIALYEGEPVEDEYGTDKELIEMRMNQ